MVYQLPNVSIYFAVSAEPYNVTANCSQGNTSFQCDGKTTGSIAVSCPVLTSASRVRLLERFAWRMGYRWLQSKKIKAMLWSAPALISQISVQSSNLFSETEAIIAMDV